LRVGQVQNWLVEEAGSSIKFNVAKTHKPRTEQKISKAIIIQGISSFPV